MRYTSIIILNYNNAHDSINCIESVEKYNTTPIKLVIIDNGSNQSDIQKLTSYLSNRYQEQSLLITKEGKCGVLPYCTLLISEMNEGYAKGNNKGLELVYDDEEVDEVMILNNDILFVEDILPKLKSAKSSIDKCGIISPVLYKKDFESIDYNCGRKAPSNKELILYNLFLEKDLFGILSRIKDKRLILKDLSNKEINKKIDLPSGSCMLIDKKIMQSIGGFDSNTFLYYEENILYKKLEKLCLNSYLNTETKCIHLGASSTKQKRKNFLIRCTLKSMDYYFKKYANPSTFEVLLFDISMLLQKLKLSYFCWIEG